MKEQITPISYPYQGRDLFEHPENYFYAECSNPSFLQSFLKYRKTIIKKMESKLLLKETNKYDHTKKKTKLCLIFEKIRIQLSRNNFILLDKFCMKYEVEKLCMRYITKINILL